MKLIELFTQIDTNKKEIYDYVNSNCSQALNAALSGAVIYRGIHSYTPFFISDSNTGEERKSAYTSNYYTILFDKILSNWKAMPLRSRSFICTSSKKKAAMYTRSPSSYYGIYVVLPEDGTQIAVAPTSDIWQSFDDLKFDNDGSLNKLNMKFKGAFGSDDASDFERELFRFEEEAMDAIDSGLTGDEFIEEYDPEGLRNSNDLMWFFNFTKQHDGLFDGLEYAFDPKRNGFKLIDINNFYTFKNNEMWFSGKAAFIDCDIFQKMFETY